MRLICDGLTSALVYIRAPTYGGRRIQRGCNMSRWATRVIPLLVVLGGMGNSLAASASPANDNSTLPFRVFARVPANGFSPAVPAGSSCGVDQVNNNFARGAALDHLGTALFNGWVADKATGRVPATLWLVLDGADDFYVTASTGEDRPDVATALHNSAFARSGFAVTAYLVGVPIGDYRVAIYYRIDGKEMMCPTNVTVSVQ